MRKLILLLAGIGILGGVGVALAAPAYNLFNAIRISSLGSSGNPCVNVTDTFGSLGTTTCGGAGGAFSTTTINGLSTTAYTFSAGSGLSISTSAPGTITFLNTATGGGATTTLQMGAGGTTINGPSFILATGTATGLNLNITGSGSTVTFTPQYQPGYVLPTTTLIDNLNTFYVTPSNRITAGTNLAWSGNTLNGNMASSTVIAGGTATHSPSVTLATSSDTNLGLQIVCASATCTFTPQWIGTLADARITSSGNWNNLYNNVLSRLATATTTNGSGISISTSSNSFILNIPTASASLTGQLSTTDWNTFNNKQSALSLPLSIANGGTATTTLPANNGLLVSNGTNYQFSTLPSCSDGTASKLLYNNSTGTFTCGTDQSGGGGSVSGGTTGYVATWASSTGLTIGTLRDNGTVAGVNATSATISFLVKGAGTLNPFSVSSSTGTELLTVLANGNVGISSSSPSSKLSVNGDVNAGYFTATSSTYSHFTSGLVVGSATVEPYLLSAVGTNNTTGIGDLGIMGFNNLGTTTNNTLGFQFGQANTAGTVQTVAGFDLVGVSHTVGAQSASLSFATRNANSYGERFRINFDGKIAINTSSPAYMLDVYAKLGVNPFNVSSSSNVSLFNIAQNGSTTLSSLGTGNLCSASGSLYNCTVSGSGVTASGTAGMLQFFGTASALNANANLLWDNTVARLALGTTSTSSTLTLQGQAGSANLFTITSSTGAILLNVAPGGAISISGTLYPSCNIQTGTVQADGTVTWGCGTKLRSSNILSMALPDTSGNVYADAFVNASSTPLNKELYFAFLDSATKDCLYGNFPVPRDYVGSASIVPVWSANTATVATTTWEFSYRDIATGAASAVATWQETASTTSVTTATRFSRQAPAISVTSGNFTAADSVPYKFCRDGTDSKDTMAATATIQSLLFYYAN